MPIDYPEARVSEAPNPFIKKTPVLANIKKLEDKRREETECYIVCNCGRKFEGKNRIEVVRLISAHWKEIHGVAEIEQTAFAAIFKLGQMVTIDNLYIKKEEGETDETVVDELKKASDTFVSRGQLGTVISHDNEDVADESH